jgi:hypothetical protein
MDSNLKKKLDSVFETPVLYNTTALKELASIMSDPIDDISDDMFSEEELDMDSHDEYDEIMNELLDMEETLANSRMEFFNENTDLEPITEVKGDTARTVTQLIKQRKEAYKNKKDLVKKIGTTEFKKRQKKAAKKRRLNKIKLKKQRERYAKSAKGKRSARLASKRNDMLNAQGKNIDDIVKIPKISGILGKYGGK